jgi:hypothetical protein
MSGVRHEHLAQPVVVTGLTGQPPARPERDVHPFIREV